MSTNFDKSLSCRYTYKTAPVTVSDLSFFLEKNLTARCRYSFFWRDLLLDIRFIKTFFQSCIKLRDWFNKSRVGNILNMNTGEKRSKFYLNVRVMGTFYSGGQLDEIFYILSNDVQFHL